MIEKAVVITPGQELSSISIDPYTFKKNNKYSIRSTAISLSAPILESTWLSEFSIRTSDI